MEDQNAIGLSLFVSVALFFLLSFFNYNILVPASQILILGRVHQFYYISISNKVAKLTKKSLATNSLKITYIAKKPKLKEFEFQTMLSIAVHCTLKLKIKNNFLM